LHSSKEVLSAEEHAAQCKKIAVIVRVPIKVMTENLEAPIIAVTEKRSAPVGAGIVLNKSEHPLERSSIIGWEGMASAVGEQIASKEHLKDKSVVRDRILKVDTVAGDL
jgi:hypothetical protein